jgi:hypothetical protein
MFFVVILSDVHVKRSCRYFILMRKLVLPYSVRVHTRQQHHQSWKFGVVDPLEPGDCH